MIEVLQMLLNGGLIFGICYIVAVIGKCIVAELCSPMKNTIIYPMISTLLHKQNGRALIGG